MIDLPTVSRKEPKNSKLTQSADVVKAPRLHEALMMFNGFGTLSASPFTRRTTPFSKSEGIGLAKDNSELVLPCITFELGHSDLVRQHPTRTGTFAFIVVVDSSSVQYGVCW
jgi:hypothetical protein